MRYGFVLPWGDARTAAELAAVAEAHGWDGFFCWESIWGVDAWVALTAAAMRTSTIRLGTMLTPLPRRKPWDVASQTATLDNLSGGRVILSVGLGAPDDRWWVFEPDPGRKVRAEMLDEGLEMLRQMWSGKSFGFSGKHYRARPVERLVPPPPVQRPRIPVWVVGGWPRPRSMRRAARWDGWLPNYLPTGRSAEGAHAELTPEVFAEAVRWIREQRAAEELPRDGYEMVMEGTTPADDPRAAAETVRPWAAAGATWWLDADWSTMEPPVVRESAERRLRAGPPRPS
ncbi:MAG: LLM class flavin-dependent oxidoreductase [Streptosporangiales bacterium]|nr:LLM class flavin-dependent oxidoreductase [Streptosporangiales bacterium]